MTYARLISDYIRPGIEGAPDEVVAKAGQLVFTHYNEITPYRHEKDGLFTFRDGADGYGQAIRVPKEGFELNPKTTKADFGQLISYYMAGRAPVPNFRYYGKTDAGLNAIASGGGLSPYLGKTHPRIPGAQHGAWARGFVQHTQMDGISGKAWLLMYVSTWDQKPLPRVCTFSICDHEIVEGAGARHERGWHPSKCILCGLNTSVDSSD